jgi:hypothetical protein
VAGAASGAKLTANGIFGGHCICFDGLFWAIWLQMTDIQWKLPLFYG